MLNGRQIVSNTFTSVEGRIFYLGRNGSRCHDSWITFHKGESCSPQSMSSCGGHSVLYSGFSNVYISGDVLHLSVLPVTFWGSRSESLFCS